MILSYLVTQPNKLFSIITLSFCKVLVKISPHHAFNLACLSPGVVK